MTIKINAQGTERKRLVQAIAAWLGEDAHYCGAPTFAYEIARFTVARDGSLSCSDLVDSGVIERLLHFLSNEGFDLDMGASTSSQEEASEEVTEEAGEAPVLCACIPLNLFTDATLENLKHLIASKAGLIKKALAISELPINIENGQVCLPWFPAAATEEERTAYEQFICKLGDMARNQKRIIAKEKEVDNEKYAFRCFLLRLGFIGAEYKDARKILLRNLSGSSAFKGGHEKEAAEGE